MEILSLRMGFMKNVEQFVRRHNLFEKNSTILVGVSGGPDSVALLHFLYRLRQSWNLNLIALTINHQLRDEAAEDVDYVQSLCHRLEVPCVQTKINVKQYKKEHRIGTQLAARRLRYDFFEKQMKKYAADYLALGHHADDQIETMFMSMTRSASTVALSGIPVTRPFAKGFIIRPLLAVTKQEIEKYCDYYELNPVIDPSNKDPKYTRNYFRKSIIPLIKAQNENIHLTMQQLSENLQKDENYLQQQAQQEMKQIINFDHEKQQITFRQKDFLNVPDALQSRIFHLILNYLYEELPRRLTYTHEQSFFSLLNQEKSYDQVNFPKQLIIEKSYENIKLYFRHRDTTIDDTFTTKQLHVPDSVQLPDKMLITTQFTEIKEAVDQWTHIVELSEEDLPLIVRTRQPGDRMTWKGLKGSKKIKDIFIDAKIPHSKRDSWPLITTKRDEIIWLVGLRKGLSHSANGLKKRRIKLTISERLKGANI